MARITLARPLDPEAVQRADDAFYNQNPAMIGDNGERLPLEAGNPDHVDYREQWNELYIANGGQAKTPEEDDCGLMEPPCAAEYKHLLHVTGEESKVYCLTDRELDKVMEEQQRIDKPFETLRQALNSEEEDDAVRQAKTEAWEELKALDALPLKAREKDDTLLDEYRSRWQRAVERLEKQKRRAERIRGEVAQLEQMSRSLWRTIRYQTPSQQGRNAYRQNFLRTLRRELQQTLPAVEKKLAAYEGEVGEKKHRLGRARDKAQRVRAAVEAQIASQVAEKGPRWTSSWDRTRLREEAEELAERVGLEHFINDDELETLAQRQIRIEEIDEELRRLLSIVESAPAKAVAPHIWKLNRLLNREETERNNALLDEKKDKVREQEKALNDISQRDETESMDRHSATASPQWKLVEVKHTGEPGYRYIRREVLEQARRRWPAIDTKRLKEHPDRADFENAPRKMGDVLKDNTRFNLTIAQWSSDEDHFLNQLNTELIKKTYNEDGDYFQADVEAQMMRFSAGAAIKTEYNPSDGQIHVGGNTRAEYSLLSGSVSPAEPYYLPDEKGDPWRLSYVDQQGELQALECGHLRRKLDYRLQGYVGASVMLGTRIQANTDHRALSLEGQTRGEAFAGGTLKNEASVAAQWAPAEVGTGSEEPPSPDQFKDFFSVNAEVAVSAGIGAGFDFRVAFNGFTLVAYMKAHLVFGPGGRGGVAVELNGEQVWEIIQFIRWSLEESDFRFLEWVSEEAFEFISLVLKVNSISGQSVRELAQRTRGYLQEAWESGTSDHRDAVRSAENVVKCDVLSTLTPVAKAELLNQFSEKFEWIFHGSRYDYEPLAEAAMAVLDTVHKHREFVEILKRMDQPDGGKGGLDALLTNYERLFTRLLFSTDQADPAKQWLAERYPVDDSDDDSWGDPQDTDQSTRVPEGRMIRDLFEEFVTANGKGNRKGTPGRGIGQ